MMITVPRLVSTMVVLYLNHATIMCTRQVRAFNRGLACHLVACTVAVTAVERRAVVTTERRRVGARARLGAAIANLCALRPRRPLPVLALLRVGRASNAVSATVLRRRVVARAAAATRG